MNIYFSCIHTSANTCVCARASPAIAYNSHAWALQLLPLYCYTVPLPCTVSAL